jgi:hypothetical protein
MFKTPFIRHMHACERITSVTFRILWCHIVLNLLLALSGISTVGNGAVFLNEVVSLLATIEFERPQLRLY